MKCFECGGEIVHKDTSLVMYDRKKRPVFFENVCAGECVQCGEKFLDGTTLDRISKVLESGAEFSRRISVPVASLACAH